MLIRQTINDLVAGRKVDYRSLLSDKNNASILKALKDHGEKGLWRYLHTEDLIGHAGKPQNSINGSFVDCLPSRDCTSFCYATKGNYRFSNPLIKSELVSWAVEKDPIKSAKIAANNYRGTQEYYQNKALRLFDMGDGSMEWLPFIKEMNKEGIRLQIFSKNPEFLKQVPEQNWRALSVDNSNFELAAQHSDLPLAVVFDGQKNGIDFVRSNLDRILVILPIKQGQKVLADKTTLRRMLGIDAMISKISLKDTVAKRARQSCLETWAKSDLRYGHLITPEQKKQMQAARDKMLKAQSDFDKLMSQEASTTPTDGGSPVAP